MKLLLGLWLPILLVGPVILAVPAGAEGLIGVSTRGWALFLCAQDAKAFFTASGQLGALLLFFLSVGETYSIASMLGFPGGVFAHGEGFSAWFFGYILLSAPILFFLGPLIAAAGRLPGAATLPDFFARHYQSRALELVIAIAALVPVGTMQFLGLKIVFATLAPDAPPLLLITGAGAIAFVYVATAGLRTSAFVAVLKDLLMIASILMVSGLALSHWHSGTVTPPRPRRSRPRPCASPSRRSSCRRSATPSFPRRGARSLAVAMLLPRVPAIAIIAGIITGDAVAMTIFGASVDVAGLNPGLIGLIANAAIVALVTALRPRPAEPSLASRLRAEAL